MICLSEFIRRFKEQRPDSSYVKTPRHAYFVIEFLRNRQGVRDWYSPLLVVSFLPNDSLKFYYMKTAETDPSSYGLSDASEFKYHDNWDVLEVVRPDLKGKTIVRIVSN